MRGIIGASFHHTRRTSAMRRLRAGAPRARPIASCWLGLHVESVEVGGCAGGEYEAIAGSVDKADAV